jgi:hypothetical protein
MDNIEFLSIASKEMLNNFTIYCCCHNCIVRIMYKKLYFNKIITNEFEYNENEYNLCKFPIDYLLDMNFELISLLAADMVIIYKKYNENVINLLTRTQFISKLYNIIRSNDKYIKCEKSRRGYLEELPNDIWNIITSYITSS